MARCATADDATRAGRGRRHRLAIATMTTTVTMVTRRAAGQSASGRANGLIGGHVRRAGRSAAACVAINRVGTGRARRRRVVVGTQPAASFGRPDQARPTCPFVPSV